MNTLLIELFTEELPPKALKNLGISFGENLFSALQNAAFLKENATFQSFATPRRLAVSVSPVLKESPPQILCQKLMPKTVGLDENGKPTPALLKKLEKLGVFTVENVQEENEVLFLNCTQNGKNLSDFLNEILPKICALLPIPKVMTYQLQDGWSTMRFARPAHNLLALLDETVLPLHLFGLTANHHTQGHRFMGKMGEKIALSHAESYEETLRAEFVVASFEKRLQKIKEGLKEAAAHISAQCGKILNVVEDEDLLNEVAALTEYPVVYVGRFDEAFLSVPQECLILTMKANQKYFPLLDEHNKLFHQFLMVANLSPQNPHHIIHGNERVLKARLSDARFFFEEDQKTPLNERVPHLAKVRYHPLLGNQLERCQRVHKIAQWVTERTDPALLEKINVAATLFKADLNSEMVGEFPELEGVMGRYYALHDGVDVDIALAIEEHYHPRFAGDSLPQNSIGKILALADKTESLVGLFGIQQTPTGDKDPFSLRRAAIGLIRLLTEGGLNVPLEDLFHFAAQAFTHLETFNNPQESLTHFVLERFAQILQKEGFSIKEVDSVFTLNPPFLSDAILRLNALKHFLSLPEALDLAQSHKRVHNILKKSNLKSAHFSALDLKEIAEKELFTALEGLKPEVEKSFAAKDYTRSLALLAQLKAPLTRFFNEVMVNVEEERLKNNRLSLLFQIAEIMQKVADLSKL